MIKHGILALLTLGQAYGLQIRNELSRRTHRATPYNVGQIYATLDRLTAAGLVHASVGARDGSPLYALTDTGAELADQWCGQAVPGSRTPWDEMLFHVLLVRSLPSVPSAPVVDGYRGYWRGVLVRSAEGRVAGHAQLPALAERLRAEAALAWLERVAEVPDEDIPLDTERPPRGRPAKG